VKHNVSGCCLQPKNERHTNCREQQEPNNLSGKQEFVLHLFSQLLKGN